MKDLLIRLSENANGVASMLSLLDRNALAKGQLILPQRCWPVCFLTII